MFIVNFCLNMFRPSLCPSSGEQRSCSCISCTALVLLDVVGSGCGALRCSTRALVLTSYSCCILLVFSLHILLMMHGHRNLKIRCLLLTSVSACFGHHAYLQENKGPVTAFGVLFWFYWMWLVAVVGRCLVGCER